MGPRDDIVRVHEMDFKTLASTHLMLLDLFIQWDWSTYLADYGRPTCKYLRVNPNTALALLEKFHNWLSPSPKLPLSYKKSYPGNYTDDSENWRPVVVSRLLTKYKHDVSDTNICTSAAKGVTCSIENVLRSTRRFQKWTSSNLLTPDLVQTLISTSLGTLSLRTNGLNYHLYYTGVRDDMIGMFEDGRLFITDATTIGVIDKQEGKQLALQIASFVVVAREGSSQSLMEDYLVISTSPNSTAEIWCS
ncbi:UNVERIFIED_CONTAM: hypothetical protein FKN15_040415 [Acipenser sinensis]